MISRDRILEAAGRVYAKHGFRGATTRLIAIEAGVNEVTLFRTFGSKGALLEAVLTHSDEQFSVPALPTLPVDPQAELTAYLGVALDKLRAMRPLLVHATSEVDERPEAARFACEGRHHAHEELRAYVLRLQANGLASDDADVNTAVAMLVSAVMGDVMGRPMVADTYPPIDEAAARYVRCFFRMIGANTGAAATTHRKSRSRIA
ncbi:MAG: helix-turn-helix domain-containing protein [bacterium]